MDFAAMSPNGRRWLALFLSESEEGLSKLSPEELRARVETREREYLDQWEPTRPRPRTRKEIQASSTKKVPIFGYPHSALDPRGPIERRSGPLLQAVQDLWDLVHAQVGAAQARELANFMWHDGDSPRLPAESRGVVWQAVHVIKALVRLRARFREAGVPTAADEAFLLGREVGMLFLSSHAPAAQHHEWRSALRHVKTDQIITEIEQEKARRLAAGLSTYGSQAAVLKQYEEPYTTEYRNLQRQVARRRNDLN